MFEPSVILYWGNNSYRASQFAIKLDGPIDPNTIFEDIRNRPSLRSLFLHEYIHFLQDVTTRYGLMKAANMYAYTSQIAHCIRIDSSNRFTTPQMISQGKNVDNVILFNSKTWKHSLGSGFEVRTKYERKSLEISNIKTYFCTIQAGQTHQISYLLTY